MEAVIGGQGGLSRLVNAQTGFVGLLMFSILVSMVVRRRELEPADTLAAIVAVMLWLIPLTQQGQATWRAEAALVPLALLLGWLPRPMQIGAVLVCVVLAVPLASAFFQDTLV